MQAFPKSVACREGMQLCSLREKAEAQAAETETFNTARQTRTVTQLEGEKAGSSGCMSWSSLAISGASGWCLSSAHKYM